MVRRGAMDKAYNAAKDKYKKEGEEQYGEDSLQWNEFRVFMIFLKQYFEYYAIFKELDSDGNFLISLEEFKKSKDTMAKYGVTLEEGEMESEFKNIDTGNSGKVDFDEFCDWAIKKSLDADGEPEDPAIELLKE